MAYDFKTADEYMHPPTSDAHFNESVYSNAFDIKSGVGGWMRLGNRVNEKYAELSVCLYLPDGRIACQFQRPAISSNDCFNAGGLQYRVEEPTKKITMTYKGELLLLNDPELLRDPKRMFDAAQRVPGYVHFVQTADSPIHGGVPTTPDHEPMYGHQFSLGHFNQHTRAAGEITCDGQTFAIDGFGWRDHSWGPRLWQNIHYYRLFIANLGSGRGLMLLKITDATRRTRRLGVLLVDGQYEEVEEFDLLTDWNERKDPRVVRIGVRTANRSEVITGEIMSLAPLRNRRKIDGREVVSRIAEGQTRFTWGDVVGYGMTEYIERFDGDRLVGYPL